MSIAKGIKVQPSRFSALNIDSNSDSEGSGGEWCEVVGKGPKSKGKEGAAQPQQRDAAAGFRPLSKSAKKRARKKRNQQSSSESKAVAGEVQSGVDGGEAVSEDQAREWQERETEAADREFQRELEEAILQSKITAEKEQEIEKQRKAAFALKKQSKKGVKLSLQSLHRGEHVISDSDTVRSPQVVEVVNDDSAFFERLSQEVESEIRKQPERRVSESQMSPVEESARVAHVMDELEKRDKIIARLRKENETLLDQMKEVKGRNQTLCKILGQGEFSTKTQLLEQMEELTTVKNELTTEVERLHSLLEQERSRNKSLQAELTKHSSKTGKQRHN